MFSLAPRTSISHLPGHAAADLLVQPVVRLLGADRSGRDGDGVPVLPQQDDSTAWREQSVGFYR